MIPKESERSDLALETELNAAILEIAKEDFLLDNCDLQSLFSESLNGYYSDEIVLWLGSELTNGKKAAFQRLADVLEPVHTVLEMGLGYVDVFRVVSSFHDSQGDLISEWEAVLGGSYSTGAPIRWRTVRVWKQRVVIAERIEGPGVAGPERDLVVENVDAIRRTEFSTHYSGRREPDDLEPANAFVART
ncbi:MAG TPA: hypothetical protein VF740_10615 [Candidatus Acidoferrum sp.]